jgi:hypothetical protein
MSSASWGAAWRSGTRKSIDDCRAAPGRARRGCRKPSGPSVWTDPLNPELLVCEAEPVHGLEDLVDDRALQVELDRSHVPAEQLEAVAKRHELLVTAPRRFDERVVAKDEPAHRIAEVLDVPDPNVAADPLGEGERLEDLVYSCLVMDHFIHRDASQVLGAVMPVARQEEVDDEVPSVDDRTVDVEHDGEFLLRIFQAHPPDVRRKRPHPVVVGHGALASRSDVLGEST